MSVHPSVKCVDCDKTEERSVQIFIPYVRSFSLFFWEEEWLVGGNPFYLSYLLALLKLMRLHRMYEIYQLNTWRVSTGSMPKWWFWVGHTFIFLYIFTTTTTRYVMITGWVLQSYWNCRITSKLGKLIVNWLIVLILHLFWLSFLYLTCFQAWTARRPLVMIDAI